MAKKKKGKGSSTAKPPPEKSFGHSPFSDLEKGGGGKKKRARAPAAAPPSPAAKAPALLQTVAPRELDEGEVFTQAMDALGGVDFYQGKFGAHDAPSQSSPEAVAAQTDTSGISPELLDPATRSGLELFEAEMQSGGVDRIRRVEGKRVIAEPRPPIEPERRSLSKDSVPEQFREDEGGSVSLNKSERRLLSQAFRAERRDGGLPEVTLRGLGRAPALERLESFLSRSYESGSGQDTRYLRVIAGKGKQSKDAPVLKHAAAEFFVGAGRRFVAEFAPERNRDGDFGAYIVRLRSRS